MNTNNYIWTDNPTVSGISLCDTDVLNDCLMHLKYEHKSGSSFSLFDIVPKDHVLNYEETEGFAQLGTYVYKNAISGTRYGYPDFYNKVVEEYEDTENTTETLTINGIAVTITVNPNGHKFYNIADKDSIDELYNTTGTAWFYGVDEDNERVFLPRNKYFFQNGDTNNVGNSVEAGLPDITGTFRGKDNSNGSYSLALALTGAFYGTSQTQSIGNIGGGSNINAIGTAQFSAARSNSIYGNSDTVQPPAVSTIYYMVVGSTNSVQATTVSLSSDSALAPISFDTETGAIKLDISDGLKVDNDGNLAVNLATSDFTEITSHTKDFLSGFSFPSNRYINLTLGSTGTLYTAPANGWFCLHKKASAANQYGVIEHYSSQSYYGIIQVIPKDYDAILYLPALKGEKYAVSYSLGGTTKYFKFIYAEGAE